MTREHFEKLVKCGIKQFGLVAAIGQGIRNYADEYGIALTEQELAEVLTEVHNRIYQD